MSMSPAVGAERRWKRAAVRSGARARALTRGESRLDSIPPTQAGREGSIAKKEPRIREGALRGLHDAHARHSAQLAAHPRLWSCKAERLGWQRARVGW